MIDHKHMTTSTNDDARSDLYGHFDVVWADIQSAGRGQRGHTWLSDEGLNLTFSVVLTPRFLPVTEQFLISEVVALALVDTLADYDIACRIKWTNDIYAQDSKIVGVLIEHALAGNCLIRTIVGVGINVNQRTFASELPNPASMASLTGREFCREEVLNTFITHLKALYAILEHGDKEHIESRYRTTMYHLDERHTYAYPTGERFDAILRGVRPSGELCLEHDDGTIREYAFKEVEFCLPHKQK